MFSIVNHRSQLALSSRRNNLETRPTALEIKGVKCKYNGNVPHFWFEEPTRALLSIAEHTDRYPKTFEMGGTLGSSLGALCTPLLCAGGGIKTNDIDVIHCSVRASI